ncbi:SURF1 family protein [Cellulomonas sp. RIT-PI-Y]|uniref:SURF1 family cytochrome oxidase biogenesis protein n=1 Tax=Cellulomonas sp. RIT-PI-Y TaxID=3035297 RepID=UPI0021DA93F7|nr:SURF1 family protein [Cellulomonas sp. RIT-PI-Y]
MTLSPAARRATGLVLLAIVLATACTFLGRWQWNRHVNRDAAIRLVQTNYDADPVPLADLVPTVDDTLDPARVWHPVTVTGTYDVDATVLLRNRPVDSQPGFHVLVPLVQSDGTALIVDRGWVAWDDDASGEVDVPAPPAGEVSVTARLRPQEVASGRSAPAGQVQAINVDQVLAAGDADGLEAYSSYGALVSESPAAPTALGTLPMPSTDPGSHLSYAFQWWTFGIGALVGFGWMARRELLDERGVPRGPGVALGDLLPAEDGTVRVPRRRRVSDEDTEDALIDAQLP